MAERRRIAMWSGPRNLSTAMMRSFGARPDTDVVDEPFYAAFLAASGIDHPMREATLAAGETDPARVAAACAAEPPPGRLRYEKHMTHHMLPGFPLDWLEGAAIAFLIRDPAEVAASYDVKRESWTLADIGTARQVELFEHCAALLGRRPPVVDAADIRRDPARVLGLLCEALGIAFTPAMLSWDPGRRPTDGVWAAHWYGAVERSTGFAPPGPARQPPAHLADLVAAARPDYGRLARHALR